MASLCAIGISIIRWGVCPRRGNGQGLSVGESERSDLVNSLQSWEADLPSDLRLSELPRGVELIGERSGQTILMHMVLFTLYLRLAPHRYVLAFSRPGSLAMANSTPIVAPSQRLSTQSLKPS